MIWFVLYLDLGRQSLCGYHFSKNISWQAIVVISLFDSLDWRMDNYHGKTTRRNNWKCISIEKVQKSTCSKTKKTYKMRKWTKKLQTKETEKKLQTSEKKKKNYKLRRKRKKTINSGKEKNSIKTSKSRKKATNFKKQQKNHMYWWYPLSKLLIFFQLCLLLHEEYKWKLF